MTSSRTLTEAAQFHIQTRRALSAAQHSGRHVGLLMIGSDSGEPGPAGENAQAENVLITIAGTLRDSDIFCRLTEHETAVLLSSLGGPEDAFLVAEKILHKLGESLTIGEEKSRLQLRVGVAVFPYHVDNASSLLESADVALHFARKNGQSCVGYSPEFKTSPRPPVHLRELRQAIVQDQLFLLYQPKIDLRNDRITGLEALARWRHPVYGLIMPDEFIPLAERTGLIVPLTLWVLNQSIRQCRLWQSEGIHVSIAVNLSMWNLDTPELAEQIAGLLDHAGVPPGQLELEITESAIMDDPQRAMRTLKAIRELGVHFAIDDFGTGYSSLAQLKKMPVSSIKIDKSFTQSMESDNDSAVIVRAIVELGHNLGLRVVAEGVETLASKELLIGFDCDEAQGYYFSRPVTATDVTRLMQTIEPSWGNSPVPGNVQRPSASKHTGAISGSVKRVV
jgi:EAL domain-containing protein (putative c-di-GMP-specific phosphodiesterase class I)/GGDEF domain-containing protein